MGRIRFQEVDGKIIEYHTAVVHRFSLPDSYDMDHYASTFIERWENSPQGEFILNNATKKSISVRTQRSHLTLEQEYAIIAELELKKLSEFYLKFGKIDA